MTTEAFYPSCVVKLTLRVERKLFIRVDEGDGYVNEGLTTREDTNVFVHVGVPKSATIRHQGHTQASTFKLVFDYAQLPVDPRTIAACAVEVYLGTVSAAEFDVGISATRSAPIRYSQLQTDIASGIPDEKDLILVGTADDWSIDVSDSSSEVHLEGRDLRAVLIDSPLVSANDEVTKRERTAGTRTPSNASGVPDRVTPGRTRERRHRSSVLDRIRTDVPIHKLVAQLLAEHTTLNRLEPPVKVVCDPADWLNGVIPSPGEGAHVPRHRRGARGGGGQSGAGSHHMTYWDAIIRYCQLVGAVPYFQGRDLHIRPGYSLFDQLRQADPSLGDRIRTPFRPNRQRELNGDEWGIRRLVYGRDIQGMKLTRKYAGNSKPKTVRCVAVDPSAPQRNRRARLLEAVWPPRNRREARSEGAKAGTNSVGGEESHETLTIAVQGVRSQGQLLGIAKSFYEQIGRQEMKGEVSCERLTSFGGSNADPDLLRCRVGDAVELLVDASRIDQETPIASALNRSQQLPFGQAVREVQRVIADENLARAIVASHRGAIMSVLRYFRVGSVDIDWKDQAVSVKLDLQNYWTPRFDHDLEEQAANARANARRAADAAAQRRGNSPSQQANASYNSPRSPLASYRDGRGSTPTPPQQPQRQEVVYRDRIISADRLELEQLQQRNNVAGTETDATVE